MTPGKVAGGAAGGTPKLLQTQRREFPIWMSLGCVTVSSLRQKRRIYPGGGLGWVLCGSEPPCGVHTPFTGRTRLRLTEPT